MSRLQPRRAIEAMELQEWMTMSIASLAPDRRSRRRGASVLLAVTAIVIAFGTSLLNASPASAVGQLPCDIYATGGTPCVAAFSSTRALFQNYNGPLYQVKRASNNQTLDIGLLAVGDYANAAAQDAFCAGTTCVITIVYDQTSNHNDLTPAPGGPLGGPNNPAVANKLPVTLAGHSVYGIYLPPVTGYRRAVVTGTAVNGQPESMYMVASGTNVNNGCCADFGNVEVQVADTGNGHMDTLNLSLMNSPGATGNGPWVQADLENGVFQGFTTVYPPNAGIPLTKFVTATLKNNGQTTFALKAGNAQSGALTTYYSGSLPAGGYAPMHQEGSIVLGVGGDNSQKGTSSFFEGVMTFGYASDATENAVQANVVAAGYSGETSGGGPGSTIVGPGGKCVDVEGDDTAGLTAHVQLWDCKDLAADQHWSASATGGGIANGTLTTLGLCLDVTGNGTANFSPVELWTCNGGGAQVWIPQPDGSLKNPQSGRCLDDPMGVTTNGTDLQIYDCNGNTAQQFTITNGVPLKVEGKCLDLEGVESGSNGERVILWDCTTLHSGEAADRDQQWRLYPDQTIRVLTSGRCLDVVGNGTALFTQVEVWDCNGVGGQKWVPQANGSLKNPQSGLCLDLPGGLTNNGRVMQIYTCNGEQAQVIKINGF
ncbi:arabinofuranosidase catalytic domain-containing protein [Cellulomonas sp. KRMCY2]|uniref:arabinofuranosidase catalytic domain-containing protein n=1 Tax=Cellulomonas sp. KRMCY2 TaxID=1304865 RepID=UPI001E3FBC66|nr:arabinofuranosidase catalytic domain-containing protein [Cellulomonas sp. KRMCY2]